MKRSLRKVVLKLRSLIRGPVLPLHARYPQYRIGRHSYGGLIVRDGGEGAVLSIGDYCSIAEGVKVFTGLEHRADWVTTFPFNVLWPSASQFTGHPKTKGDVVIGNDVWIGTEAVILSGVKIGDGAIVGARAVVSRDVPPYAIVAGNPAKFVKYRFDENLIDALLTIKWWDWDESRIEQAMPYLLNNNVEKFIQAVQVGEFDSTELMGVISG